MLLRYENDRLTVSHDLANKRAWAPCVSIGMQTLTETNIWFMKHNIIALPWVDNHLLFTEGVRLPTGYYFGMSATTGDLSDNHDIVSIKTYELDTPASVSREERADIMPEVGVFKSPFKCPSVLSQHVLHQLCSFHGR